MPSREDFLRYRIPRMGAPNPLILDEECEISNSERILRRALPRRGQPWNPRPLRLTSSCNDLVDIQTYMPEKIRYDGSLDLLCKIINDIELRGQWDEVGELVKNIKDKLVAKLAPPTMAEKLAWLEKQCITYKCETAVFEPQLPHDQYRFVPLPPTIMDTSPRGTIDEFRIRTRPIRPARYSMAG